MSASPSQNFSNHGRFPTAFVVYAVLLLCAAIDLALAWIWRDSAWGAICLHMGVLLLAITLLIQHALSRTPLLTLQDRIIRLESEVRCERLLPEDLKERARGLTLRQRIASRFASDAEFPELIRKILDENIQDGKTIKQLVKDWQADHQRV